MLQATVKDTWTHHLGWKDNMLGMEEHGRRQCGEEGQYNFMFKVPETLIGYLFCSSHR